MQTILGIDFSGAALAGRKIWVCRAALQNQTLHFHELVRGADLPGSGDAKELAFPALVQWIAAFPAPLCGFDFPLSLHEDSVGENWRSWLTREVVPCPDADALRAQFPHLRRRCDIAAKAPFSPLNKRLYRQTFHGLRDVIWPLLQRGAAALPFDETSHDGAARLIEICPASFLKREKLYLSYKGRSTAQRTNRETIWHELAERSRFIASENLREQALDDAEGDALDAVLAALCVHRALQGNDLAARAAQERIEGRIFF